MQDLRCSESTPSQRLAAAARRERLAKIAAAAHPDTPVSCPSASMRVEKKQLPPEPVFSFGEWIERQRELHPMPKKPWFSIVDEIDTNGKKKIRIEEIQRACCEHFGVTRIDFLSSRRTMRLVIPRQVAMYLCKTLTLKSLPEIGRRFGGRDHTTILHAVNKMARLIQIDPERADEIEYLKQGLCA